MAGATAASPTSLTDSPRVQPQSDVELSPGKYHYRLNLNLIPTSVPVRKTSEDVSVGSTDSNTRSPHSMPVPTVPRRAGVPRKKHVKPAPEVPEERLEEVIAAPSVISAVNDHKAVEIEEEPTQAPEHKELDHKIIDDHRAEIHDEPQSIDSDAQPAEELIVESKPASSGESKEEGPAHDVQSPPPDELKQEHEHEQKRKHVGPDQPDDVDTIREDQAEDDEIIDYSDEHSDHDEELSVEHHEHQHIQQDDDRHVGAESQPHSAIGAADTDEEARRKRVAERLAKMGGINPFAAPPLRPSSEETDHADSLVVSSHASLESVSLPVSPSRSDIPTKRASLPSHEVAKPHPLAVEPKVEEQGGKEISDGK